MITTDGSRYLYTYDGNQKLITDLSLIPTQAASFACYNNEAGAIVSITPLTSVETLTANYSPAAPPGTYVKGASTTLPVSYTLGGSLPDRCSNTFMLKDSNMITPDGSRYLFTYDSSQNQITDLSKIPTQAASFACNNNAGGAYIAITPLTSVETLTANYSSAAPPGTFVKGALSTLPVSYTMGGSLPDNCSNTFMLSSDSNMITTDGSQRYLYTYDVNQNLIKDLSLIPTQAANFACYNNAARELVVTTPLTSVETLTANYS